MATFSVSDTVRKVQGTGNGSTTAFAFNFQVNNTSDVKVYLDATLKSESTHYDIQDGSGSAGLSASGTGSVVFGTAPGSSVVVTILSDVPIARTSVYTSGGNITAAALEDDFDTITMALGDREERDTRALRAPPEDLLAVDMELPGKTARLGTVLGFNASTGNPEAGPKIADVTTLAAVTADIQTLAHIEDGTDATDAIQSVATIATNVSTVAGIASNVTSVAGAITNINLLAPSAVIADMALLGNADVIADMALLANSDVIADMNTLATSDIVSDLNTLATSDIVSDINTLATSDVVSDLNTLATSDIISDMNTLATSDIVSDLNTLATTDIVNDLNTLATSDIVTDLNLLATSAIVEDLSLLATSDVIADMAQLAGSGANPNITTLTASGDITGGTFAATGDTAAGDNASIGYTAAEGLILTGQGSTNDVTIKNDADADVIEIPTGTQQVVFDGAVKLTQTAITGDANRNIDVQLSNNFFVTMSADIDLTFTNTANAIGSSGIIVIKQDGTGGRDFTLKPAADIKTPVNGATIVQATNANEYATISYYIAAADFIMINYIGDYA